MMSLVWLRYFSHCLCNIFLQWNDWWRLAMLKCNQNDLKDVWIRTILVAVFLQNAWNLLKILPNVSFFFFFFFVISTLLQDLWHSAYSMTFTVRKHKQISLIVLNYYWEVLSSELLRLSWKRASVFRAGCVSCIHGEEGSEVWIKTWISESTADLKTLPKCDHLTWVLV